MTENAGHRAPTLRARIVQEWTEHRNDDDGHKTRFKNRQVEAVLRLAPLTATANLAAAAILVMVFWSHDSWLFLSIWAAAVAGMSTHGFRVGMRARRPGATPPGTHAMRRAVAHTAVLAALWAVLPLNLLGKANPAQQIVLVMLMVGAMCGGASALASLPTAAIIFAAVVGCATSYSVFHGNFALAWPLAALLALIACAVVASVWATARSLSARSKAEAAVEREAQVVGLLLREREGKGSNILWQTSESGRLVEGAAKLASVFGWTDRRKNEILLPELLKSAAASPRGERSRQVQSILDHLDKSAPFRDIVFESQVGDDTRWWACTADPVLRLDGSVAGWRGVLSDVTPAEEAKQRLTWLAHHDPLTGLANRYHFRKYLAELLSSCDMEHSLSAVICIDLDNFKDVNDTLGHAVGDELLKETSRRLAAAVREGDLVARLGGDEFAVVLRNVVSPQEALAVSQRLLQSLEVPCLLKDATVMSRASMGLALAPRDGTEIDSLLNHADLALYAAKGMGKGTVMEFTSKMREETRRRLRIEQALRHAIERGEMWLEYQPQVNLETWRVTGFEALLRWWTPELGLVSPAEFVPIAEECGAIQAIGLWVLESACEQAARWRQPLLVSVNVSPVQAMSQDLYAITTGLLARTGLKPERLEIEITESVFMSESRAAIASLAKLRSVGIRIALDDFGTGYSSLSYLQRFPFDTLKIDRSFVKEIAAQRSQRAIVKMIMALARTLGMRTVAEGVEDGEQLGVLNRYRCETVQGYLVSKPIKAEQIAGFLATWDLIPKSAKAVDPVATDFVPMTV